MEFFFLNEDVSFDMYIFGSNSPIRPHYKFDLKSPAKEALQSQRIPFHNIYVANNMHFLINKRLIELNKPGLVQVYAEEGKKLILSSPKFPKYIGNIENNEFKFTDLKEKLQPFAEKESFRLAVFLSSALGDMIIAVKALELFHKELSKYFKEVKLDLLLENSKSSIQLLMQQNFINRVYQMPITLHHFCQYNAYIDLDRIFIDYGNHDIHNQPMIDVYLDHLSLDKNTITDKRTKITLNPEISARLEPVFKKLKSSGRKLLLFHPTSAVDLRSIPNNKIPEIIDKIIQNSEYTVVATLNIDYKNDRFINLSGISKDFDHYTSIISQMDAMITVDTSTYHLADSFNIPTVVLFTSINPKFRVKYYPFTDGILLDETNNKLLGKHVSIDQKDLEYASSLFDNIKISEILDKLKNLELKKHNS